MKDLPHHIKKLNRRIVRSVHREELEEGFEMPPIPNWEMTAKQKKKQAKQKIKKERLSRTPSDLTPEERNRKMKNRVPVFDRLNNAKPKRELPSKKKRPKI
jgi:hypothetical protein